ncbi:helix-turn-helix domain-containing protein [Dactylosporangium sp. NPDC048998]|uniref:helix-turn-helix domain-containing protein n=1 Tax=Dactylosporangium sp. NPDC048998 TaxID=3363976 RepID=UPI00371A2A6E
MNSPDSVQFGPTSAYTEAGHTAYADVGNAGPLDCGGRWFTPQRITVHVRWRTQIGSGWVIERIEISGPWLPPAPGTPLGPRIAEARTARGLTQQAVAEALGVDRNEVNQWEAGHTRPEGAALVHLGELLGWTAVDIADLVRGAGVPPSGSGRLILGLDNAPRWAADFARTCVPDWALPAAVTP